MIIITYKFTGLTPLLMDNIESLAKDIPTVKLGTQPNKGDLEKIASAKAYINDDGEHYLKSDALRSSLLTGCKGQKFPGSRMSPANIFKSLIYPAEEHAILLDPQGNPITEHAVQIDSAVNGKARVLAVRARVDEWHTVVPFEIDDEWAPPNFEQFLDNVLLIWNRAGRSAGVGAWRPENCGRFGRYEVERLD